MRLANRALIAALAMLIICTVAFAQTRRSERDPRNQSPSVGTGGPEGGPTGLFTIYDGSTIRRGEFTFSIAYSNYDRDPGNVDLTDIPASFNVGLNDHIELFFKSNLYRGVKVNNPSNLSSFYLPNVSLCTAVPPCTGAAIILAPSGPNVGTLAGQALFRPLNNQPFVQFPFVGGSAGNFGQGPGQIGSLFGFPGFNAQIGAPLGTGGRFSGAASFPGMGSPVGSILPGIVLATTVLPATALTLPIEVPTTFTIAPAYLPDAPFISRQYGESSFTNYVVGAKIRFTGPHNPLGLGVIPFYRWYPDNADSFQGFNQLQRGAGPGGSFMRGDFGLVGFIDGRIHRHANLSVNFGYIFNSNEKSEALGDVVLLDRPNELLVGVGMDFPVNKHFQPVFELRTTRYTGTRTPNAFENDPVELVGGVKIFPKRWWGFGIAYRRHLNEQDQKHINPQDFNTQINQLSGVFVPGRGIVIVPGTTRPATTNGFPTGFRFSSDPNGFIVQLFAGHRNARGLPPKPNEAPVVTSVTASSSSITLPCPPGLISESCPTTANLVLGLSAVASDPDGDVLVYTWSVTGGKITGDGRNVTWDLTGARPGTYTATVTVADGTHQATGNTTVTIADCTNCVKPPCPTVNVSCPSSAKQGEPVTFTANYSGSGNVTYNWSVSAGTISSGQGTSSITVDTANLGGQTVTATVEIGGDIDPACPRTASCTTPIEAEVPKECRKVDEYGDIKFNDEKARLDNFASSLQTEAGSQGYIIGYGACEGQGLARANRAKDYLVNTRGIDAGRVIVIDGGCRAELWVELYVCPPGAPAPQARTDGAVTPCPECRKKRTPRPRVRHGKKKAGDDEE
jgi:PKD domain